MWERTWKAHNLYSKAGDYGCLEALDGEDRNSIGHLAACTVKVRKSAVEKWRGVSAVVRIQRSQDCAARARLSAREAVQSKPGR